MAARVIAIGTLKGGTGKTTAAVNLSAALADRRRVILVDADGQGTAAAWCSRGTLPMRCEAMPLEYQAGVERWVARITAHRQDADLIVIDCPPHVGIGSSAAFMVADLVLIPVGASLADLLATERTLDLARAARGERGGTLPACILVPCRIDRRTAAGREIEQALRPYGERIGPAIGQRAAFVDALTAGQWVGTYAPDSKAAADVLRLAALVRRILEAGRERRG